MIETWLTENPLQPVLWGILLSGIAGAFWFMLRKRALLLLAFLIFMLTIGCVITERLIVTDKEQITEAIFDMADAVKINNADGVIKYVNPTNPGLAQRIRDNMAKYRFTSCYVIGFNEQTFTEEPADSAMFEFIVWANVEEAVPGGVRGESNVRVTLEFEKSDGQWYVKGYDYAQANSQRARQIKY